MNSSGRQPPRERVEEKILQEARQNRLPPPSRNQKRPVTPGKSGSRGTPLPHSPEVQRQPLLNPYITGKHSFEASLDSAQRRNFEKRQGATGRSFHAKTAVMKPSMSQGLYSFSGGKQIAPRIRGQPSLARTGEHYHSSSKEHETAGMQRQDFSTPHGHRLGEKSPKTPHRRQHGESSSTLKSKAQSSAPATSTHASASHMTSSSERGKIVNPNYRPLASTYAKSGTEQGQHSRSDSQPRHHGEGSTAPSNADTVRDGYKSHHSSKPKGRHHSESSSQPHGAETVKDGYTCKLQGRSRHYSESSTKHHNGHTVKDRDTCKSHVHQEQSRRPSESCSKISEIDAIKERRKAQEEPHPRPRHHSESGDRHTVSDKKKANEVHPHRQRSHSELSHKYHHLGPVKRKKSSEAPKVKLSESIGVLHDASHEEEMLACKQQNTMMWLLNSTQTVEENQSSPPKQLKQKTHDQNHSPSTDHHRGSFIVVEDKAGWARRIYSDGSSGVTSGMEPAGRSSHSSVDSSGCQKRHAEGNKELHLVKKSKMHRKNSSSSASHQGGPSYVKLLSMAKQNLSNGHNASESKTSDNVPDRIRKNSHQSGSGSDPEHQPSCRNLQEGILNHDFDEEKVERLFKASLSARPKLMQQSPAPVDKQKVRKQSSVESEVSLDSCVNSSNPNSTDKISLEKVGRLFNASLNTKSKTAESPTTELKAAKCHLEDAQSPERPQYTCSLSGGKTSSDQSDKRITMSFRKVHSSKKYLGAQRHKFHEKTIKRLRLEASSRAVRIPVKRLRLKSDRIFLTDDFLQRLGRSSSIIVNTARKHNVPHGKKSKGHKHKTRRRVLPLYSSSDPDTPSVSNSHQPPLQREIPLRHSMSDTAAMSESSVSSGVATLFQELSSDPSKMDQPSCSSSPAGVQGRSKVKASPKFSGNISKLKQRIGKRLQAAVHGDKPQYSYTGNESDSTIFGSSAAEGYSFGDSDYIPFSSEDVIFEETVEATETDEKMNAEDGGDQGVMSKKEDETDLCLQTDPLAEPLISDESEDDSSPASVSCPKLAPQADPCDSMPDLSENDDADEDCAHPAADGTSDSGRNAVPNEQPLSDRDLPQLSVRDNDHPALVPETFQGDVIPDLLAETQPKVDPPVLQSSEQPLPSQLSQTKAPEEQHTGELLEDTTGHAAGEPEEGCSGEALDDSESLPDVDLNAGDEDHRDVHEISSDSMEMDFNLSQVSTDDSHPANTPTTIMKEVSQIGNVPLPGTPSKPYPFPLNDSMSPGRLSQEMAAEEPTTKKRKLISLDKMLDMKKKTDNFAATFDRLKEDVSQGGFVRQMEEQQKTGNGDQDDGSGDELKDQEGILSKKLLQKYDVPEEPKIPIVHPGEDVFDQTKLRQIFKYDDHMASLAGCEFKPDKPSALESLMLKATPDEMVEMLRTFAVEMAYHSKPCPPAFMLWLFRLMSVHTDCNVVNKVYQTMWSILNAWPVEHPDIVPWAPSVADLTQILVNYGASFNELLPPGLVHPEFRENDIRPPREEGSSDQETERVQPSVPALTDAEKARYHGNNLVKVIKILTLALVTRKTMDKFPYSEEDVCCLAVLICKTSLEKYFIRKAAENDFSLCLVALFACVPEASWKSQAERLCHVLPHVAIHHHNLAYITHLMPNCTERGRYMSRQLAYMCLKKLSSDEAEHNVNGFHPDLKVQDILDIISSARPHDKTDYYQLHSMIQILDLAIGNEVLDTSEKESLQSLNKKLNLFRASIKEKANSISRSQVKDLIVRMTLRLTLMDQAIVSDQVNLFNRFLPLSKIKEENVEEHFPTSQEDAVSISSEEGDDKLDALDEELEEEEEEKEAPSLTAVQSLEKR